MRENKHADYVSIEFNVFPKGDKCKPVITLTRALGRFVDEDDMVCDHTFVLPTPMKKLYLTSVEAYEYFRNLDIRREGWLFSAMSAFEAFEKDIFGSDVTFKGLSLMDVYDTTGPILDNSETSSHVISGVARDSKKRSTLDNTEDTDDYQEITVEELHSKRYWKNHVELKPFLTRTNKTGSGCGAALFLEGRPLEHFLKISSMTMGYSRIRIAKKESRRKESLKKKGKNNYETVEQKKKKALERWRQDYDSFKVPFPKPCELGRVSWKVASTEAKAGYIPKPIGQVFLDLLMVSTGASDWTCPTGDFQGKKPFASNLPGDLAPDLFLTGPLKIEPFAVSQFAYLGLLTSLVVPANEKAKTTRVGQISTSGPCSIQSILSMYLRTLRFAWEKCKTEWTPFQCVVYSLNQMHAYCWKHVSRSVITKRSVEHWNLKANVTRLLHVTSN